MKILFVCTGNICRSPMAEGYMDYFLRKNNIEHISVDSAGTFALINSPPSHEAILVVEKYGFSIDNLRSQQLNSRLLEEYDIVFIMTEQHRDWIKYYFPQYLTKVEYLRKYSGGDYTDIPDPMGLELAIYSEIFQIIKLSIDNYFKTNIAKN